MGKIVMMVFRAIGKKFMRTKLTQKAAGSVSRALVPKSPGAVRIAAKNAKLADLSKLGKVTKKGFLARVGLWAKEAFKFAMIDTAIDSLFGNSDDAAEGAIGDIADISYNPMKDETRLDWEKGDRYGVDETVRDYYNQMRTTPGGLREEHLKFRPEDDNLIRGMTLRQRDRVVISLLRRIYHIITNTSDYHKTMIKEMLIQTVLYDKKPSYMSKAADLMIHNQDTEESKGYLAIIKEKHLAMASLDMDNTTRYIQGFIDAYRKYFHDTKLDVNPDDANGKAFALAAAASCTDNSIDPMEIIACLSFWQNKDLDINDPEDDVYQAIQLFVELTSTNPATDVVLNDRFTATRART